MMTVFARTRGGRVSGRLGGKKSAATRREPGIIPVFPDLS
jgi:hypothetical protein